MFQVEIAGDKEVAKHYENRFKEEKFNALVQKAKESGIEQGKYQNEAHVVMNWLHTYRMAPWDLTKGLAGITFGPEDLYPYTDYLQILVDFAEAILDIPSPNWNIYDTKIKLPLFRYVFRLKMNLYTLYPYTMELKLDEIKLELMKRHPLEVFNQIDFRIKVIEEPTSDRMRLETRNHRNLKELA